jgi:hypothetical protein
VPFGSSMGELMNTFLLEFVSGLRDSFTIAYGAGRKAISNHVVVDAIHSIAYVVTSSMAMEVI